MFDAAASMQLNGFGSYPLTVVLKPGSDQIRKCMCIPAFTPSLPLRMQMHNQVDFKHIYCTLQVALSFLIGCMHQSRQHCCLINALCEQLFFLMPEWDGCVQCPSNGEWKVLPHDQEKYTAVV